jgi:hypothetical protein
MFCESILTRLILAVALAAASGAGMAEGWQDRGGGGSRPVGARETPRPGPRDRYSSSRPLTLERFRSVFHGYDSNDDGVLTLKEANAAGMGEAAFQRYDVDRNRNVTAAEFEWVYGCDLRSRGQVLDPALARYLEALDAKALELKWTRPASVPSPPAETASKPKPHAPPGPASRGAESRPTRKRY